MPLIQPPRGFQRTMPRYPLLDFEINGQFFAVTRQLLRNVPVYGGDQQGAAEADRRVISRQPVACPSRMLFLYNNRR
jgi:hypothetical protein